MDHLSEAWSSEEARFANEVEPGEEVNAFALLVLGTASASSINRTTRERIVALYDAILATLADVESPCALAHAMLGAAAMVRTRPGHRPSIELLEEGGTLFEHLLNPERRPAFAWFEAVMGCDYVRLPEALVAAGEMLARRDWRDTGRATLIWLAEQAQTELASRG